MTSEKINSFVGDLVAMARAMEQQPELEQRISLLEAQLREAQNNVTAVNDSNDILRAHIDNIETRLSEVTKERDDASFRELVAQERLDAVRNALGVNEPVVEVKQEAPQIKDIIPSLREPKPDMVAVGEEVALNYPSEAPSSGERAADPTLDGTTDQKTSTTNDGAISGPYANCLFVSYPGWVSRADWLIGGGTDATYDWRDGNPLPDGWVFDWALGRPRYAA